MSRPINLVFINVKFNAWYLQKLRKPSVCCSKAAQTMKK